MSETKGRFRSEVDECRGSPSELKIAAAIDRLAADVASVKAKVDAVSPEDVKHFVEAEKAWVALIEERCGVAIRQRDEARAEVERLRGELAAPQPAAPEPAYYLVTNERDMPIHVSRMHPGVGWGGCTITALYAAPQPAGQGISPGLPETQSTRNAAPAAGWLTEEERELLALVNGMADDYSWDPRSTWRCNWPYSRVSLVVKALLSRAGSPPVVEVPAIGERDVPKRNEAMAYRAALDKAGVPWKEVGRE